MLNNKSDRNPKVAIEAVQHAESIVGEFIAIPAWRTEGMVIDQRAPMMGSEQAIEVLVEVKIDDPRPRWYRLEPSEFEVL